MIVNVLMMTSALLSVSEGIRVADTTGTHSMNLSMSSCVPKIAFASSRPKSASNPSHLPVAGFFTLNGGLSSCEPIRSLPFVWIAYWYVESSNFGALALALAAGCDAAGVLAPPQAAAKTIASATPTVRVMPRMCPSFRRSVPDDLAQELLRALLPGRGEELPRR